MCYSFRLDTSLYDYFLSSPLPLIVSLSHDFVIIFSPIHSIYFIMSHSHPPSSKAERAAWRAHHCSWLSGEWGGKSVRMDPSSGSAVETIWAATQLDFDPAQGKITGNGVSLWQDQSFPFELLGAFSSNLQTVELLKSHRGHASTLTHMVCSLDVSSGTLSGSFVPPGGAAATASVVLQRLGGPSGAHTATNQAGQGTGNTVGAGAIGGGVGVGGLGVWSNPHMARSVSGSSTASAASLPPPPHSVSASTSGSSGTVAASVGGVPSVSPDVSPPLVGMSPPKDLSSFLLYHCFPDHPQTASKIHAILLQHEIHDPESLTTLSAEDWREMGIVLGHRSRIKLQLTRFFPIHMKQMAAVEAAQAQQQQQSASQQGAGSQGGESNSVSPVHSMSGAIGETGASGVAQPSTSLYHSHPAMPTHQQQSTGYMHMQQQQQQPQFMSQQQQQQPLYGQQQYAPFGSGSIANWGRGGTR